MDLGDLVAQHRADGAVHVGDLHGEAHRDLGLDGVPAFGDQLLVERLVQTVVLARRAVQILLHEGRLRFVQHRGQVQLLRPPVLDGLAGVQRADLADHLVDGAEAQLRHEFADLFGDEQEEVLDEFRLAGEPLAQHRVLGGHTHRAGVEVADAHHDAARDHQRRCGKAVLLGAEQRGDDHVTARLELAVHLHDDPVAQTVEQQGLLRLGQAQLPRGTRVLLRGQRGGTGATVVPGDQHHVGVRLRDAGRDRTDTVLRHQLHVDAGLGVGVLQVVDQLRQILDRVDVVVRRRRDQADTRGRVPDLGHPRVHLVSRKLTALTGLGALGHLDLDVGAVRQVVRRDTEPARRHLLDGTASPVAVGVPVESLDVLAALARVRPSAKAVHRDREGLVHLGRDRAVAHRTRGEALDDLAGGLHLVDRDGLAHTVFEREQATQRGHALALVVDQLGVLLEHRVLPGAGGVLELEHRVRVEQVVLALTTPLVFAADLELAVSPLIGPVQVGEAVPRRDVGRDVVEVDTAGRTGDAGEVLIEHALVDTDGLEELGAGVGGQRRDAHLGHHLQHTLAGGLDVVGLGLVTGQTGDDAAVDHVVDGLERHVRVDGGSADTHQHGHVMHLTGVTGLDHQADLGAGAFPDQVVVDGRRRQQRRDRREPFVGLTVRQHDDAGAVADGLRHLGAHVLQGAAQAVTAVGDGVQAADDRGPHAVLAAPDLVVGVDADQLGQVAVAQDRLRYDDLPARVLVRVQQVALGADDTREAGHDLFPDGIQRRVGDLREQLLEVVVEHPRPLRQHSDRGIGAHGAQRLGAGACHRHDQLGDLFVRVTERLLPQHHAVVRHLDVVTRGQVVDVEQAVVEPLLVGVLGRQLVLDLLVVDDPALGHVHEEHAAGLQAQLLDDGRRVQVQDAGLGGHDDQAVIGDPDARRTQAVAVQDRADDGAVGEAHRRRAVPRLHERRVVLVERPPRGVHGLAAFPRLGDHHQHRVVQRTTTEVQQLERLVEPCGVRGARRTDRENLVQVVVEPEHVGVDERLTGPHPVLVAVDGVDLTVVGDPPERVRQRPRRERVGREARVHDAQRALHPLVLQVQVERLELRGGEHALVDDGLAGQAGEVHRLAAGAVLARALGAQLVFGPLADDVGAALELHAVSADDEDLTQGRHGVTRQRTQRRLVERDVAPAQDLQALGFDDLLDGFARQLGVAGRLRQECDTGGVAALGRQLEAFFRADGAEELVRNLQQDACAVAGVRLGTCSTAVLQVQQCRDRLVDDVAAPTSVNVRDHGDATGVVLMRGVVQPDLAGSAVLRRHSHLTLHHLHYEASLDRRLWRRQRTERRYASVQH